jgi:hypothetical protein
MKVVSAKAVECNAADETKLPTVVPPKAAEDEREPAKDFDWLNDDSIMLREQPETACYFNQYGGLVIRQRGWPDNDSVVIIAPNNIGEFLDKITDVCGIPSFGGPSK